MRHRKNTVRFGRQRSHYKSTLRLLASALIVNKSIKTTKVKAKEASRFTEKLVTIAKDDTVHNRRKAYSILRSRDLVKMLFKDIAPLFKDRLGGYTRVMLTAKRHGDNAQMAILEFVEKPKQDIVKKPEKKILKEPVPKKESSLKAESPERPKAKKEELSQKEEPKKDIQPSREPAKPKEVKPRPMFFKQIFGRKKDM